MVDDRRLQGADREREGGMYEDRGEVEREGREREREGERERESGEGMTSLTQIPVCRN